MQDLQCGVHHTVDQGRKQACRSCDQLLCENMIICAFRELNYRKKVDAVVNIGGFSGFPALGTVNSSFTELSPTQRTLQELVFILLIILSLTEHRPQQSCDRECRSRIRACRFAQSSPQSHRVLLTEKVLLFNISKQNNNESLKWHQSVCAVITPLFIGAKHLCLFYLMISQSLTSFPHNK